MHAGWRWTGFIEWRLLFDLLLFRIATFSGLFVVELGVMVNPRGAGHMGAPSRSPLPNADHNRSARCIVKLFRTRVYASCTPPRVAIHQYIIICMLLIQPSKFCGWFIFIARIFFNLQTLGSPDKRVGHFAKCRTNEISTTSWVVFASSIDKKSTPNGALTEITTNLEYRYAAIKLEFASFAFLK